MRNAQLTLAQSNVFYQQARIGRTLGHILNPTIYIGRSVQSARLISNVESLHRLVQNIQELFNALSKRNADGFNLDNHSPSEHSPVLKGL